MPSRGYAYLRMPVMLQQTAACCKTWDSNISVPFACTCSVLHNLIQQHFLLSTCICCAVHSLGKPFFFYCICMLQSAKYCCFVHTQESFEDSLFCIPMKKSFDDSLFTRKLCVCVREEAQMYTGDFKVAPFARAPIMSVSWLMLYDWAQLCV